VDTSLSGTRVSRVLDRAIVEHGKPEVIVVDNGPEFSGKAIDAWAHQRGVQLHFIRPGKPIENAYVESLNGKFRDECLNQTWFLQAPQVARQPDAERVRCTTRRPDVKPGPTPGGRSPAPPRIAPHAVSMRPRSYVFIVERAWTRANVHADGCG
jgi:transposase InsO family protein